MDEHAEDVPVEPSSDPLKGDIGTELGPEEKFSQSMPAVDRAADDLSGVPRSPKVAGLVALVALIVGVALLVFAAVRYIGDLDDEPTAITSVATTSPVTTPDSTGMVRFFDETGRLSIAVPETWVDITGNEWVRDGDAVGLSVAAAPDREAWRSGWGTAGIFVGLAETGLDSTSLFDDFSGSCTLEGRFPFSVAEVAGEVDTWTDCGDASSTFFVAGGVHVATGAPVLVQLVLLDPGDGGFEDLLATLSYQP